MNRILKLAFFLSIITVVAAACGNGGGKKDDLAEKKAELQKLRDDQSALNQKITTLEEELAKMDTSASNRNAKLVAITPVSTENFNHFIELQGKVEAENTAYVTPRGQGGQVEAVYVKQGDQVKKGQLLLKLDDAVIRQQIEQLKVQQDLAETLYERRKNLWEKQIGTEVELLQAKTTVDNLNKQLALLNEQLAMTNVHAQISGVADMVNIKVGEFFTPATANMLGIRIVNTNNLKVVTQVPESYLQRVDEGDVVEVNFPDANTSLKSKISVKGSSIDPSSRSFYIESKIPASTGVRPNQIALVKIRDYTAPNAITIPMNTLQNDERGKYVMVAVQENGKLVAKKRQLEIGELYGNDLEVKAGLQPNDALITEGFQGLYEGQPLVTKENI